MRLKSIVFASTLCLAMACSRGEESQTAMPADDAAGAGQQVASAAPYVGHDYTCADGLTFNARMAQGNAVITLEGKTLTLSPVAGSFGAQYEGEGVTFIARGNEAMFSRDGALQTCKAQ
jgi:membrane-bound inhibitor of C-type lysozyme